MLFQNLGGILVFLCGLLLILLVNLLWLRRVESFPAPERWPFVSVLLPVRNEIFNVEACLRSLLVQEYEPYEVIVLDDESDDGTSDILRRLGQEYPRLKVISGQPLPAGWVGKTWACHQLAAAAQGDYWLFTDADTRFHPSALQGAAAATRATQAGLLTGLPRQRTDTWGERLALPVLAWVMYGLIPLALAARLRWMSTGVGQFLFFERGAYQAIGGHSEVRFNRTEDLAMAARLKRLGLRWMLVDLTNRVECRMYSGLREVIDGFTRTLYAAFNFNLPVFAFVWTWLLLVFCQPVAAASWASVQHWLGLPWMPPTAVNLWMVAACMALSVLIWLLVDLRFKLPLVQALLYPLTLVLFFFIAVRSAYFHHSGKGARWKGRQISSQPETHP